MTIKDFIEKKIVIAFTSPEQIEEFRKMCVNHDLRMAVTNRLVSTVSLREFFEFPFYSKKVVHLVYNFNNSGGVTWSTCDSVHDIRYEEKGYKTVTFEEFKNDKPYKIIIECDGNDLTTAKMIVNGKIIKESKAKRNPEDKFDFKIASKLVFDRLFGREKRKEVARPAKAGETIKVISAKEAEGVYKNGDIFKVEKRDCECGMVKVKANNLDNAYVMWDNEPNTATICDEEYVVLE